MPPNLPNSQVAAQTPAFRQNSKYFPITQRSLSILSSPDLPRKKSRLHQGGDLQTAGINECLTQNSKAIRCRYFTSGIFFLKA